MSRVAAEERGDFYRCNCGAPLRVQWTRATEEEVYRMRKCKECGELYASKEEYIQHEDMPRNISNIHRRKNAKRTESHQPE